MRSRHIRLQNTQPEINITAFMNLMVVLIPFLLITAVFSQMTVLDLNLPPATKQAEEEPPKLPIVLEVIIYEDRFDLIDRQTGPIASIANINGEHNYADLKENLLKIKQVFPEITSVSLLLEAGTPYDKLIQTMDAVRLYPKTDAVSGEIIQYELFPDISIGDAPVIESSVSPGTSTQESGA